MERAGSPDIVPPPEACGLLPPGFILRMAAAGQIPSPQFASLAGRSEDAKAAMSMAASKPQAAQRLPPPGLEAVAPQPVSVEACARSLLEDTLDIDSAGDMASGGNPGDGKVFTLQAHLTALQCEDPRRVFIARRIGRMGFRSEEVLAAHYSHYGQVERVLVAHSKVKPFRSMGNQPRIRPGSLGFIVMEDAECVERILEAGLEQVVNGHHIHVERFKRNAVKCDFAPSEPEESSQSASVAGSSVGPQGSGIHHRDFPRPEAAFDSGKRSTASEASASTSVPPSSSSWPEAGQEAMLKDLTNSLKLLAVMANSSLHSSTITGRQCLETAALSRLTHDRLQQLTDLCQSRLEACNGAIPTPPGAWAPWMNQNSSYQGPQPVPAVQAAAQAYPEPYSDAPMAWTTSALRQAQEIMAVHSRVGLPSGVDFQRTGGYGLSSSNPESLQTAVNVGQQQVRVQARKASRNEEVQVDCKESQSAREMRAPKKQTLGMHLTELQGEDPRHVFIARRISRMGFRSQEVLAKHYSQYGKVCRVLVAHSKVKAFQKASSQPRIRPGSLGFVVMDSMESVQNIFDIGKEQTVAGCHIRVEPFQHTTKAKSSNGSGSTSAGDGNSNDSSKSSQEKASAEGGSTDSQLGESSDAGSADGGGEQGSPVEKKAVESKQQARAAFASTTAAASEA
mmetsp:Transcript_34128/g.77873  ORF Transcript_34128/g.77873 Transcript_34128/m.77873 type:complete len:678 (-) Transcript_34128:136-2169(-)